jgi:hypothetical protein
MDSESEDSLVRADRNGPPVGGRPHSTGPGGGSARGGVRGQTWDRRKAAGALQGRNRQSSHCQQKEQLRLRLPLSDRRGKGAVGGQ